MGAVLVIFRSKRMVSDHKEFAKEVDARAAKLFKAAQDTMRAFRGLMETAGKDGALDAKTKELMALAVGIAVHCEGCINFHTRAAIKKGATREEVAETAAVAIEMGGGPAAVYGAQALEAFDQLSS
jgi:AhpD family alkylhydroperoxidase